MYYCSAANRLSSITNHNLGMNCRSHNPSIQFQLRTQQDGLLRQGPATAICRDGPYPLKASDMMRYDMIDGWCCTAQKRGPFC